MAHGTCRECGAEDRHLPGRGLCAGCYDRRWRAQDWGPYDRLPQNNGRTPDLTRTEKPCAACKVVKPLDAFARNNRRPDGRGSYCKPCARERYHEPARQRNRLIEPVVEGERQCRTCLQTKPVTDFYWSPDKGKRDTQCTPCRRDRDRETWAAGRRATQRTKQLREKYDLTDEEYAALLDEQGGTCAICGQEPPSDRALAVDHDHATGARRSLLCGRCNPGLGLFLDDPRLLRLAALYLERHSGVGA